MDFDRQLIISFPMKNIFNIVRNMSDLLRNLKISRETPGAIKMTIVMWLGRKYLSLRGVFFQHSPWAFLVWAEYISTPAISWFAILLLFT